MSTQSDYSLTRAAVTLLAALLLTAGTAREAGAAGSQSSGDNVTGSGIPAARAPNAAQRRV
ncbi:hypothetical protein [Sodalis sp. (in: enterobacteria)]|uniref:hypothetical protein n=1 Tax=Sodalis sp. (in: enterobacteria) TaxID=1898979 RepID=UPI003F338746